MAQNSKQKLRKIVLRIRHNCIVFFCIFSIPLGMAKSIFRHILPVGFAATTGILIVISGAVHLHTASTSDTPPPADLSCKATTISTALGERRWVVLEDGTQVNINSNSSISVCMTSRDRWIELTTGEALFDVHHENRPFRVISGDAVVEDLATAFGVRRIARGTHLYVTQGNVKLYPSVGAKLVHSLDGGAWLRELAAGSPASFQLHTGQQAEVPDSSGGTYTPLPALAPQDIARLTAWRDGQIISYGEPLSQILEELRRYRSEEFRLATPEVGERKIGITIQMADLDYFLLDLHERFNIDHEFSTESDGRTVITLFFADSVADQSERSGRH